MQQYYEQYRDKGLVVLGIDEQENPDTVKKYIAQSGFTWTFVIDTDGKVTDKYLVDGIPAHFFIDPQGVIRAMQVGPLQNTPGQRTPVDDYLSRIMK